MATENVNPVLERPIFVTDLDMHSAEALMCRLEEPRYRAIQLLRWIYNRHASSFEEMTDFPETLRVKLAGEFSMSSVTEIKRQEARDGTVKALLSLYDKKTIETVVMPAPTGRGYTVCVSSQVGCPVCCPFCATGRQGFERNLSAPEIVDQMVYFIRRLDKRRITNVVFMGMGEPLANYDNLIAAIERINAPWGLGLGARNITVSTAGIVTGIERLARAKVQVGLAVSLHAANDVLRNELVPLNGKYPLSILMPAVREYIKFTGRRVSFEYCLFEGINDSLAQARELAHLIRGMNAHINLIASNESCTGYRSPPRERTLKFETELVRLGINVTLRRSYGREIKAACGQLKSEATRIRNSE